MANFADVTFPFCTITRRMTAAQSWGKTAADYRLRRSCFGCNDSQDYRGGEDLGRVDVSISMVGLAKLVVLYISSFFFMRECVLTRN